MYVLWFDTLPFYDSKYQINDLVMMHASVHLYHRTGFKCVALKIVNYDFSTRIVCTSACIFVHVLAIGCNI